MKNLIFIIIVLFLTINTITSFNIDSIDESHWQSDEGFEHHKCWKDFKGYYTEFALSAYNTVFPTPKGLSPVSFYEGGAISTDLKEQLLYVHFGIVVSNYTIWGQFYGYGANQTQYALVNGTCYASALQYPFPSEMPKFKKVGETVLGDVEVEVIIAKNQEKYSNYTRQCTLLHKGTCIPLSSNIGNVDKSNKGFALMNFYRYENSPRKDKFQLPSECWDVQPENDHQDEGHVETNTDQDEGDFFAQAKPKLNKQHAANNRKQHHKSINNYQDKSTVTKTTTKTSTKTTTISTSSSNPPSIEPKSISFQHLF